MAQHTIIDATDMPEVRRLAEQVRDSSRAVVIQVSGEDVAVMAPLEDFQDLRSFRPTPEQIAATMSAAGAWKGLIDTEQMKRDVYAARGHKSIPEGE